MVLPPQLLHRWAVPPQSLSGLRESRVSERSGGPDRRPGRKLDIPFRRPRTIGADYRHYHRLPEGKGEGDPYPVRVLDPGHVVPKRVVDSPTLLQMDVMDSLDRLPERLPLRCAVLAESVIEAVKTVGSPVSLAFIQMPIVRTQRARIDQRHGFVDETGPPPLDNHLVGARGSRSIPTPVWLLPALFLVVGLHRFGMGILRGGKGSAFAGVLVPGAPAGLAGTGVGQVLDHNHGGILHFLRRFWRVIRVDRMTALVVRIGTLGTVSRAATGIEIDRFERDGGRRQKLRHRPSRSGNRFRRDSVDRRAGPVTASRRHENQ